MKYFCGVMITSILLIAGCSSSMAEKVDPEQARSALNTALDAWKGGKSNSDLAALEPSLLMNESDWSAGNRLLDYKMEENGRLHGRQVRWVVQIKLQDKSGKVRERKATYIIDTIPRIVIVRDTFAS